MNPSPKNEKDIIFWDLERELAVTRKVLERLPPEHYAWKPHQKSMSLGQLGIHVATLPQWSENAVAQDSLDAASAPRPPSQVKSREELLALFDSGAAALREAVGRFDAKKYADAWSFRQGDKIMTTQPRATVYRIWCMNHMIHHRAQLCVYLRMLNVPVPTVYFNTADDPTWVFS